MSNLTPVAFDIETTGFSPTDAQLTVAGFAHHLGVAMALNTGGRPAVRDELVAILEDHAHVLSFAVWENERDLLDALATDADRLDGDQHYLTAFNGDVWSGGFDLRFLRTKCACLEREWPFPDIAYADTLDAVDRFETDGHDDLAGVYEVLVGEETCDSFEDRSSVEDYW